MSLWGRILAAGYDLWGRIFAAGYDRFMSRTEHAGLAHRRRELLREAHGHVVEIGAGTGANLEHYPSGLEEVVLVEPEEPMVRRLEHRLERYSLPARIIRAPAERIPLEDHSADAAVCTLVLCTVGDPQRSLSELRRVLKPDGRLLFLEHVRSADPGLARWQDRLHPLWRALGHGCNCNRSTLEEIRAAGFGLDRVEHGRMPKAPPIVRPLVVGAAAPR